MWLSKKKVPYNNRLIKSLYFGVLSLLLISLSVCDSWGQSNYKLLKDKDLRSKCRNGEAKACEALGLPKPLAIELAKCYRKEGYSWSPSFIENKSDNIELLITFFRLSGSMTELNDVIDDKIGQARMIDLLLNDPDPFVRYNATYFITDSSALEKSVKFDPDPDVRKRAATLINNPVILNEIIKNDSDTKVRSTALNKIIDNEILESLAKNDPDINIRLQAIGQITDENTLRNLLPQRPDSITLIAFLKSPGLPLDTVLQNQVYQLLFKSTDLPLQEGSWVLEKESDFHLIPIEPAEGLETLSFKTNGEVIFSIGMIVWAEPKYTLIDPKTISITFKGNAQNYNFVMKTAQLTLLSYPRKAIYKRIPAIR